MSAFKDFEREAVKRLVGNAISEEQLESLLDSARFVSHEPTGVGYFLTVQHPSVPPERVVCDRPPIVGKVADLECGFVVFLEDGLLTLECHSWGIRDIPRNFRELAIEIV